VLDDHCFETLRSNMEEDTFAVSGYLRDPLMGDISGVKIWRTECCRKSPFPDTISPETDVRTPLVAQGMRLKNLTRPGKKLVTLGRHEPDYDNALYTFSKFRLYGCKARYRNNSEQVINALRSMKREHAAARAACIGLAHGFFQEYKSDKLQPYEWDEDSRNVTGFLDLISGLPENPQPESGHFGRTPTGTSHVFSWYFDIGRYCRDHNDIFTYLRYEQQLTDMSSVTTISALMGLNTGLMSDPGVGKNELAASMAAFLEN
jgi:hypothetical protein